MNTEIVTRSEARSKGLKFFFTGKPCRNKHVAQKLVKDYRCLECKASQDRRYSVAHPEQRRANSNRWAQNNREKCQQSLKRWRNDNPEKNREISRRSQVKSLPSIRAKTAKYRAAKLKRTPTWADLDAIRAFYLACPRGFHVDHIVPLQGEVISGLHVFSNLQYLPKRENLSKGNKWDGVSGSVPLAFS